MGDSVQKLSTLAGTECHILLYCQGISLWIEVKQYANYSYGNALVPTVPALLEDILSEYDKMTPVQDYEL